MRVIDADKITEETIDQYTWLDREQMKSVLDCIADQPTIDTVPVRHGHWDCIDEDGNVWRCSVCGEDWVLEAGNPAENNMHYCTNCGAKMDEKDGDSDGKNSCRSIF